jgi:membrane protease YdiL (CAAX protease family)
MSEHDPEARPEPPLVIRVDADVPLVIPVEPPKAVPPRPGFWLGCLLTLGYWLSLIAPMVAVVAVAVVWHMLSEEKGELDAQPVIAVATPVAYVGGILFSVVVIRIAVGRGWTRELGLRRCPPAQLALAVLVLPAFMIMSEVLAKLVKPIDAPIFQLIGFGETGDLAVAMEKLLSGWHWSFVVLALGVCPGLGEELWCRGFLSRGFVTRYGWVGGVALTSAFFGILHLWPPSYVLVTAAMGAGLHFTYLVSRSLWVPIAVHLLNNSFAALVSIKAIPTEAIEKATTDQPVLIVSLAAGLFVAAGLAMWTARARLVNEDGTPARPVDRGVVVPPRGTGMTVVDSAPRPVWAVAAGWLFVALVWLMSGWPAT